MNRANGFARTSKYAVLITPPANLEKLASEITVTGDTGVPQLGIPNTQKSYPANPMAVKMQKMSASVGQQVNLHCSSVAMPGHDLQAQDVQHGSAPGRQMVQSHDYNGTIAASFYLDDHLRERHFFEMWMKMAVSIDTHKASYYDDYIGTMEIYQLNGDGQITYAIKATEVYPTTMAGIEYAYANTNQIALQSVNFQYRQWFNMTSDAIAYQTKGAYGTAFAREDESALVRGVLDAKKNVDTEKFAIKEKQEQSRQRQLTPPEIDRQYRNRNSAQREADRQKHLKPPEVDIDRHAANRKEADRDRRLRKPDVEKERSFYTKT